MLIHNKQINGYRRAIIGIILINLILFPLTTLSGAKTSLYESTTGLDDQTRNSSFTNIATKLLEENNYIGNYSFDPERLYDYIDNLYDPQQGNFFESIGGYNTSLSIYEALAILRIFGLDYYHFGANWQERETAIANELLINYNDESDSGGFLLDAQDERPSVEGTFAVVNSLWLMNELTLKLKPLTIKLFSYIYNHTFDKNDFGFHEYNGENNLKTTFQALSIIDIIYKVIFEVYDDEDTPALNESITDFMTLYSVDIFNFINDSLVDNTFFYDYKEYRSPIEDTWYALKSIAILEYFGNSLNISLPKSLVDFQTSVTIWLSTLVKTDGMTKGGHGFYDSATVKETGLAYAISSLLNTTDNINETEALLFVNSSQFLKRENRTYLVSENIHLGGFGPNNVSYADPDLNNRINVHDTYYASLVYLLSGSVFKSIKVALETSYYQENPDINISNYIVQGEITSVDFKFTSYDYRSHGSLSLSTSIDNWDITNFPHDERDIIFAGKGSATYKININNDTDGDFNWTLGSHVITHKISVRNLPIIESPEYFLNSTIFVGYASYYDITPALIKPGTMVNATIFYQNRSVTSYSTHNITSGNVSVSLTSPNNQTTSLLTFESINTTTEAFKFEIQFLNNCLLGTWDLSIIYNSSDYTLETVVPIQVFDDVELTAVNKEQEYYPGKPMDINVSLVYSNGQFTQYANATLNFISNKTSVNVFSLPLTHISGTNYTTAGEICPTRFLTGHYNLSVTLSWNTSSGYTLNTISNYTLPKILIKGIPVLFPVIFNTDYRNLSISEGYTIYYGERINFSFTVGFDTPFGFINNSDYEIDLVGGLVNGSEENTFLQLFDYEQRNETLFLSSLINPNFPNDTLETRFKIKSEWNNSYVFIRNPVNLTRNLRYEMSLEGEFLISNVKYYTNEMRDGLYVYAIDTTSVLSISFEVVNTAYSTNISIPQLDLYGILEWKSYNQSLPSIISAYDENNTHIYQLAIPPSSLSPADYQINIFAKTAITKDLMIGTLSPGFRIINSFSPKAPITLHESFLLVMAIIFFGLSYVSLRKKN